ncbi:MAG: tetratricopeptide repeat protein [Deltaproteobacteria bacterium]|nr:tetratricopeptide repeat protein [Deltaproteobacteria bacterium]
MKFDKYQALYLVVLMAVGFLIYANTFQSPFVFDDEPMIKNNPAIRMQEFSWTNIITAVSGTGRNRPISILSFAFNYYFDQYNLFGYHLANIMVHIITGILLFFFLKTTLRISNRLDVGASRLDSAGILCVSGLTALLWLVNPVQTQSVTYVVQRMNSMAAMFFILALLLYAKGRLARQKVNQVIDMKAAIGRSKAHSRKYYLWYLGCVIAGVLALGSKESSASLPFFIFLYEWYFFRDLSKKWLKKQLIIIAAIGMLFSLLALMHLGLDPWEKFKNLRDFSEGHFTMGQRLLTQTRVVIYYLSLIFYPNPSRLNLEYDFPLSLSLMNPLTTLPSLIGIGLLILGIFLTRRQRLVSFCILWFLGNLVIESSVIPLAIIFEHRLYLPSMFVCLLPVILFYRQIKQKWLTVGISCALIILCAYWTFERNRVWRDQITLWADCIKKSPHKARPYSNLGIALTNKERYDEALRNFLKAIQIKPNFVQAQYNLGILYDKLDETNKAIEHYRIAVKINPNYEKAHNNLGVALLKQDKTDEAIESFRMALQLDPSFAIAHINLGAALSKQDKLGAAVVHFNNALQISSDLPEAQYRLGAALLKQGRTEQGIRHIKRALQIDPDYAEAHNDLGGQLLQQGKIDEALKHLTRALSINPDLVEAHNNVGIILIQQGDPDAAISHFQDALRIDPDFEPANANLQRTLAIRDGIDTEIGNVQKELDAGPDDAVLHFKMGNLYLGKGELGRAIFEFEKALALQPKFVAAQNNLAMAYTADKQYHQALAAFKKLIEIDPDNGSTYYNIAVMYALQNNVPDSIAWLKMAIDKGYQNWELIKTDTDLANIRDSEAYRKLVKGH